MIAVLVVVCVVGTFVAVVVSRRDRPMPPEVYTCGECGRRYLHWRTLSQHGRAAHGDYPP